MRIGSAWNAVGAAPSSDNNAFPGTGDGFAAHVFRATAQPGATQARVTTPVCSSYDAACGGFITPERTVVSPPAVVSPPGARLLLAKGQLQEADPEWTPRTTALRPNSRRLDVLIWKFVPTRDSSNAFELPSDFLNAIELSNWLRKSHLVLLWKEIGTLGGIRPPNFYVLEVVKGALTYPPRCPFGHAVTP